MNVKEIERVAKANPRQLFTFPKAPEILLEYKRTGSAGVVFIFQEEVDLGPHVKKEVGLAEGEPLTMRAYEEWCVFHKPLDLLYTISDIILYEEPKTFDGLKDVI